MYPIEKKRKLTQTPQVNKDKKEQEVNKDEEEQEVNKQKKEQKNRTITIFPTDLLELFVTDYERFRLKIVENGRHSIISSDYYNMLFEFKQWLIDSLIDTIKRREFLYLKAIVLPDEKSYYKLLMKDEKKLCEDLNTIIDLVTLEITLSSNSIIGYD
ncbi:hypothetical protein ABK040_001533 [Willaertia magna]